MSAYTTDYLGALASLLLSGSNTGLAGASQGSYQTVTKYPWAFITADEDEQIIRHIGALIDMKETVRILVCGKTVDQVRTVMQKISQLFLTYTNWATLTTSGVWDINYVGGSKPMQMNPPTNDVYSGESTLEIKIRYATS